VDPTGLFRDEEGGVGGFASYEHRVALIGVVQTPICGHTCCSSVDENFGSLNVGPDLGR